MKKAGTRESPGLSFAGRASGRRRGFAVAHLQRRRVVGAGGEQQRHLHVVQRHLAMRLQLDQRPLADQPLGLEPGNGDLPAGSIELGQHGGRILAGWQRFQAGELVASLSAIDPADDAALYGLMDRLRLEPGNDTTALYAAIGDQREYRQLAVSLQAATARLAALPASEASAALLAKLELASRQIALVQHDAEVLVGERALLQLQSHRKMVGDYMKTALLLAARAEDTPSIELRNSETAPTP